jgi:hypothetical protein
MNASLTSESLDLLDEMMVAERHIVGDRPANSHEVTAQTGNLGILNPDQNIMREMMKRVVQESYIRQDKGLALYFTKKRLQHTVPFFMSSMRTKYLLMLVVAAP